MRSAPSNDERSWNSSRNEPHLEREHTMESTRLPATLASFIALATITITAIACAPDPAPSNPTASDDDTEAANGGDPKNGSTNASKTPSKSGSSGGNSNTTSSGDDDDDDDDGATGAANKCATDAKDVDACYECCDATRDPAGDKAVSDANNACLCAIEECKSVCGPTQKCGGTSTDNKACSKCLQGATEAVDACGEAGITACQKDAKCSANLACNDACSAKFPDEGE